jgi:hypothetical protein
MSRAVRPRRDVKMMHWMRWKLVDGVGMAYPACKEHAIKDFKGYTIFTNKVTCEACKLWLIVDKMAR